MKTQADVPYLASGKFFNHLSLTAGAPRDSELHTILLTQDQNLHSGVAMGGGCLASATSGSLTSSSPLDVKSKSEESTC